MRISDFLSLKWKEEESPLIQPPLGSPIIADPSFLGPEDSPDQRWHLFAHSIWGIHHYVSDNGLAWQKRELVVRHAMRAFVLKHNGDSALGRVNSLRWPAEPADERANEYRSASWSSPFRHSDHARHGFRVRQPTNA